MRSPKALAEGIGYNVPDTRCGRHLVETKGNPYVIRELHSLRWQGTPTLVYFAFRGKHKKYAFLCPQSLRFMLLVIEKGDGNEEWNNKQQSFDCAAK